MRPLYGVVLESSVLAVILLPVLLFHSGGLLNALVLVAVQGALAFLIHCPAHYVVGSILGIRFSRMTMGSTTLVRGFPGLPGPLRRFLLVASLSVSEESRRTAPKQRLRAMYLAGVLASAGSSLVYAFAVSRTGDLAAAVLTTLFAFSYLSSDILVSPRTGDIMRARAAGKSPP